jgi:hypothetical protein
MFIKYKPKTPHVKTIPVVVNPGGEKAVLLASDAIILRPGTNELAEEQWKAIQPHIQDEIEQKIIVPFTVPVKKAGGVTKARTLKDVPVSTARKIIESCQNVADLKKWLKQELPDEIMLLVLRRIRKFKIDPDEFGDDPDGDEDTLDDDITPENDGATTGTHDDGGGNKGGKGRRRKPKPESETPESVTEDGDDPDGDEDEIPDFDGSGGGE